MAIQNPNVYEFKCKNCNHKYLGAEHIKDCPKCGTENQNYGRI